MLVNPCRGGLSDLGTEQSGAISLRERVPIVGQKTGVVKPGETKSFRLAFDTIPESWNQDLPQLVIAQIQFG